MHLKAGFKAFEMGQCLYCYSDCPSNTAIIDSAFDLTQTAVRNLCKNGQEAETAVFVIWRLDVNDNQLHLNKCLNTTIMSHCLNIHRKQLSLPLIKANTTGFPLHSLNHN